MPLRLFLDGLTDRGVPRGLDNSQSFEENIFHVVTLEALRSSWNKMAHDAESRELALRTVLWTNAIMTKFLSQKRQVDVAEGRIALPGFT